MRLKIKMKADKLVLPLAYKSIIQGVIYNMMDKQGEGSFYHDHGYRNREKTYKMFVFSDLYGKYNVEDKQITFFDDIKLYISVLDKKLFKIVYNFLLNNEYLFFNNQKVRLVGIDIMDLSHFSGDQIVTIKTLSPIVTYTSKDKYFKYYSPEDKKYEELLKDNIIHKMIAYNYTVKSCIFEINKINYQKKKLVHFKNTFYEAYQCELVITTNYDTLKIIYDTGLSAKGSCGFGMIECKYEKGILSL